ncbi:unnamed protein product [Closterium sp. Naga37s-1]|nr:unnamed protein product [Closterium sp. Naga37s-1]
MTVAFIVRRDFIDFHSSLLGYVFNCATTFLLTNALKVSIGRPRPHFFIVCFPSGVPVYGSDGNAQCNGSSSSVMESRVSFPSGHTSMSFSGLTYAALFLAAKLQAFSTRGRGQLWRLVPSACCLAGAASVGITRVVDYWHFPFDVFVGGLIGMVVAAICYFLHYPALSNQNCLLFAFFSTILITAALNVSVGRTFKDPSSPLALSHPVLAISPPPHLFTPTRPALRLLLHAAHHRCSQGLRRPPPPRFLHQMLSLGSPLSFSGLAYLSLFLAAKLHSISSSSAHLWRLLPPALPLVGGVAVGITRIDDYWHFPFDVFVGSLIGA